MLICTDGLTNMVETDEIERLARAGDQEDIPARLISAANMAGGSDNITVVAVTQ